MKFRLNHICRVPGMLGAIGDVIEVTKKQAEYLLERRGGELLDAVVEEVKEHAEEAVEAVKEKVADVVDTAKETVKKAVRRRVSRKKTTAKK